MHRLQELVRLHRQGCCGREVARLLGMSPNTERKYREALKAEGLLFGDRELPDLETLRLAVESQVERSNPPEQEISSVEQWRKAIESRVDKGAGPTAIYDYLRTEVEDFEGSLSAVKRMVRQIKKAKGPSAESVVLHVETQPGEVAQVDFGSVGKLFDPDTGKVRKAYVFVMVLNHSRLMYASLVFDQSVHTWIDEHEKAFEFLGGVPKVVVPDNLKSAVLKCYYGGKSPELNRTYRELARHYGFKIDLHRLAPLSSRGVSNPGWVM
ncbi:IS21 family transposase [Microvenator marinus]|nr:IS21 family transposase [Microvenator marinus]